HGPTARPPKEIIMNRLAIAASAALLGVSLFACKKSEERVIPDREPVAGQEEPQLGAPGAETGGNEQILNRIRDLESQVSRLQSDVDSLRSQQPGGTPGMPTTPGQQPMEQPQMEP